MSVSRGDGNSCVIIGHPSFHLCWLNRAKAISHFYLCSCRTEWSMVYCERSRLAGSRLIRAHLKVQLGQGLEEPANLISSRAPYMQNLYLFYNKGKYSKGNSDWNIWCHLWVNKELLGMLSVWDFSCLLCWNGTVCCCCFSKTNIFKIRNIIWHKHTWDSYSLWKHVFFFFSYSQQPCRKRYARFIYSSVFV